MKNIIYIRVNMHKIIEKYNKLRLVKANLFKEQQIDDLFQRPLSVDVIPFEARFTMIISKN
jgi:hypothetical protein